jgi:hypothetical protein
MPLRIEGTGRSLVMAEDTGFRYRDAGRGVGHYAISREPAWVSRTRPPSALGRFGRRVGCAAALLACGAFLFGACDVLATGDTPGLAQDRVFFRLQDILVNGPHALGVFDPLVSAAGFCVAVLPAECAGLGATVAATAVHLVHLLGF